MGRALLILWSDADKQRAAEWVHKAPWGTRLEFRTSKRSLDQNAKMWAMLTEVSTQVRHCGLVFSADQWKALFLHAWGKEVDFVPSLDGETFLPLRSSDLTKEEMNELIEFIYAWGAQHGVTFREPRQE